MKKSAQPSPYSVRESISVTLKNGRTVHGTLCMLPTRVGGFEVEYNWVRKTDGRADYTNEAAMRVVAKIILREMAEKPGEAADPD